MFLNYIKDFFLKKQIKNNLRNVNNEVFSNAIQTVGLLIDGSNLEDSEAVVKEIILQGIASEKLKVIVYNNKLKQGQPHFSNTFGKKHINWKGESTVEFLTEFIEEDFDLLISYYDVENPYLMLVTAKSKAKFKVGFSAVDSNLNRWMITTTLEHYKLFVFELFKYLKNIK